MTNQERLAQLVNDPVVQMVLIEGIGCDEEDLARVKELVKEEKSVVAAACITTVCISIGGDDLLESLMAVAALLNKLGATIPRVPDEVKEATS